MSEYPFTLVFYHCGTYILYILYVYFVFVQASDVEEELNEHIQRLRDQVHLRRQHSQHREDPQVEELQKEVG